MSGELACCEPRERSSLPAWQGPGKATYQPPLPAQPSPNAVSELRSASSHSATLLLC